MIKKLIGLKMTSKNKEESSNKFHEKIYKKAQMELVNSIDKIVQHDSLNMKEAMSIGVQALASVTAKLIVAATPNLSTSLKVLDEFCKLTRANMAELEEVLRGSRPVNKYTEKEDE